MFCSLTMAMMTSTSTRVAPTSTSLRIGNSFRGVAVTSKSAAVRPAAAAPLKVVALVSAATKKETVEKINSKVDDALLVAGMTYQGLTVKQMMDFRRELPADAEFIVSKNTLVKRALVGTKFEAFGGELSGPNGYLFVGEDGMKQALKACSKLQSEFKKAAKGTANEGKELMFTGGCLDGELFDAAQVKKLEDLPSKQELMGKIAGMVKQVPTKVALAVNAMPRKVGYAAAALKTKMEEEESA